MRTIRKISLFLISLLMATYLAFGCGGGATVSGGDNSGVAPQTPAQIPTAIEGVVQKGPFNQGSSITISELNEGFSPIGSSYSVTTEDDLGNFSIDSLSGDYQYVEIIGTGFYYNEVSGENSDVQITLRTVSDTSVSDDLRVNVLTTLARDRIMYLVTEEDMDYDDARLQAQGEVLDIFSIDVDDISNFDVMDISEDGESNAILLAISLMLQGDLSVSDLQSLVSGIANDLEEDGEVASDSDYLDQICTNAKALDLSGIRTSLEAKYTALLGASATIPPFEDYIDTDCDGIINMNDDTTWWWYESSKTTPFDVNVGMGGSTRVEVLGDTMYVLVNEDSKIHVYSSTDGENFTDLGTPLTGVDDLGSRTNFATASFDGKLWLIGGWTGLGLETCFDDVWWTANGTDWHQSTDDGDWTDDKNGTTLGATATGSNIYLFVADPSDNYAVETWNIETYTAETGVTVWQNVNENGPEGIDDVVIFNNEIWTFGFYARSSSDGVTWTERGYVPPAEWGEDIVVTRSLYAVEVFNDSLWVLGGSVTGSSIPDNYVSVTAGSAWSELYDGIGINWFIGIPAGWAPLSNPLSAVFNDKLWIYSTDGSIWYLDNRTSW